MSEGLRVVFREPLQRTESGFAAGGAVFTSEMVSKFDEANNTLYLKPGYRLAILQREIEIGYARENIRFTVSKTLLRQIAINFDDSD